MDRIGARHERLCRSTSQGLTHVPPNLWRSIMARRSCQRPQTALPGAGPPAPFLYNDRVETLRRSGQPAPLSVSCCLLAAAPGVPGWEYVTTPNFAVSDELFARNLSVGKDQANRAGPRISPEPSAAVSTPPLSPGSATSNLTSQRTGLPSFAGDLHFSACSSPSKAGDWRLAYARLLSFEPRLVPVCYAVKKATAKTKSREAFTWQAKQVLSNASAAGLPSVSN